MPDEEAPSSSDVKFLTDFPLRYARKFCPILVNWLDALGYDQALVVRDVTHLSLYFSCLVSFIFTAMWLVDVFTLNCSIPRPWETEYIEREIDNYRCLYETVGGIIFFGTLCDSIQMLGNYDNQHRELLERKKQLMADLHTDIVEALRKAKENADKLYGMLFKMYVSTVGHHVEDFFQNILPTCHDALQVQGRASPDDEKMLRRLSELVAENLGEPGQLSTALCKKLMEMYQKVCPNAQDVHSVVDKSNAKIPRFWVVWMRHSTIKLQDSFSHADIVGPDESDILRNPGRHVFLPVEKIKSLLEGFLHSEYLEGLNVMHRNVAEEANEQSRERERLMGFGTPSWMLGGATDGVGSSLIMCCMPRLVALFFLRICCLCCCVPGEFDMARKYPKRVRLGFFWFQIISKLHERLIQGIICSVVLALFLGRGVIVTIQEGCPSWMIHRVWWACFWHQFQNSSLLFALLLHIPASMICLVRIRDLDAIIKIMADIRKLQDIRRAIQDFERSLKADAERQALMQHIEDRVLTRIQLVEKYRLHIMQRGVKDSPKLMREATCELIQCLQLAADTLRPASEWLKVPSLKQQERVRKVKAAAEDLASRNFEPSDEPVSSPSPRPSSAHHPYVSSNPQEKELASVSVRPLTPPLSPKLKPKGREMSVALLEEGVRRHDPLR